MRHTWYKVLLLSCLMALPASLLLAANGKIVGTIRDAATKEAIPGANAVVVGTSMGAAADAQGRFYILNVPPGRYAIEASAIGFSKYKVENVSVSLDQTVEVNFAMQPEAVQVGEIVVSAERRVVDKNQVSTKTTVNSDEIKNLPVVNAIDILNTTPGAFKGFVRGGRINETKTVVDGVDVSDQYYAVAAEQTNQGILSSTVFVTRNRESQLSTAANVNFDAVEQFSLTTGATGAENASATAGVINYSLKEGRGAIKGSVAARVSQFNGLTYNGPDLYADQGVYFKDQATVNTRLGSNRHIRDSLVTNGRVVPAALQTSVRDDSIRSGKYTYTPGKYLTGEKPTLEFSGSVGGNITDDWGFYASGRYFDTHGHLPNERARQADITLKSTYNVTSDFKLNAFGILNDRGDWFGWKNTRYADNARYFLEGVPKDNGRDIVASLKGTHVLSPSTFYEVQLSQTNRKNTYGYTDGNGDGIADLNDNSGFLKLDNAAQVDKYVSQANVDLYKFFRIGNENASFISTPLAPGNVQIPITRPQFYYEQTKDIVNTLKGDLTSQITYNHQFKAGFQVRLHDIKKVERNSSLGSDATDIRRRLLVEEWEFKPTEMGIYASDRMEYAGLVINIGARLDRWDPRANDFRSYYNLFRRDTVQIDDSLRAELVPLRSGNEVSPYYYVSPKFGVSHPISDEAAMFFSYSRNFIPPPLSRLYGSYNAVLGAAAGLPQFASLMQDPTRSSNYELGVQWEFLPRYLGLNFTAYMRDVENYSPVSVALFLANGQNQMWFAGQYADARGVELSIQALRQSYFDFVTIAGRLNYAYTYIKASSWAGLDSDMRTAFLASDSVKYNNTLPFSDFVYYNKVQTNVQGGSSTLTGGYDRTHRISYTMVFGFPYDIQLSSVGTFQSGFFFPKTVTATDARVSGRELGESPWNKMVDFRLEKGFSYENIRFAVYVDVKNAFNWTNIIGYESNPNSGQVLWEKSALDGSWDPTGTYKRAVGPDGSMFYDIPREYYFGVRVDF